jgi:Bifunctional DNA primase/polymerase, N-terminal
MIEVIPALLHHGYSPVPMLPKEGFPPISGWDRYREQPMDHQKLREHFAANPGHGLGVLGAYRGLVPIDVDTDDPAIMHAFGSVMPQPVVMRHGSKGFVGFWRDPTGQIAAGQRKKFMAAKPDPDGKRRPLVEIKVLEPVTIPPSLHRKTRLPYRWLTPRTLFDTFAMEHPIITPEHIEALAKVLEPWCPAPKVYELPPRSNVVQISDKRMRACAEAVLARKVAELEVLGCDRNISLHNVARCLGKFVHNGVLGEEYVRSALIEACKTNGSWNVHGAKQCHWTISSGFSRARRFGDELPALRDRPTMAAR